MIEYLKTDFEFSDERGSLTQLVHQGWKQVNYITSKAGAFRGDHYHKENIEAFYVISGSFKLDIQDLKTGHKETHTMKQGVFFKIFPYTNHSFTYLEDTTLISLYDKGVENETGEKDIHVVS